MQYGYPMNANDRLATWLDTATADDLGAAAHKLGNPLRGGLPSARAVRLQTLIGWTLRARTLRLSGRVDQALRLEARREAWLPRKGEPRL
jgi:hypothetical protein